MASVNLENVRKVYPGGVEAVKGISLDVPNGSFTVLLGPSGCGKSTLLRMIAGLETITSGTCRIADRVVNEVEPAERDIAMVFQNYALYPHMSVYDNMAYGLRNRGTPKAEIERRVREAARMLAIEDFLDRRPRALSGGQRQRVAMGRAIVREPQAFLFDEPLSNLDAKLRVQMRIEIKKVHQKVRTTTVYVTHDQVEAMTLADRVVVMNHGVIEQVGTPTELYHHPRTRFVAGFIGSPAMNFIPVNLQETGGQLSLRVNDALTLPIPAARASKYAQHKGNGSLLLGIRPEHLTDARAQLEPGVVSFDENLDVTEPMGMETLVYFPINGETVCGRVNPAADAKEGAPLKMAADLNNMHLIDPKSGLVL